VNHEVLNNLYSVMNSYLMLRKVLQSNDCISLIDETCNFADLSGHHSRLTKVTDTSNMNRRSHYYLSIGAQ
jgi:hypothetical protein